MSKIEGLEPAALAAIEKRMRDGLKAGSALRSLSEITHAKCAGPYGYEEGPNNPPERFWNIEAPSDGHVVYLRDFPGTYHWLDLKGAVGCSFRLPCFSFQGEVIGLDHVPTSGHTFDAVVDEIFTRPILEWEYILLQALLDGAARWGVECTTAEEFTGDLERCLRELRGVIGQDDPVTLMCSNSAIGGIKDILPSDPNLAIIGCNGLLINPHRVWILPGDNPPIKTIISQDAHLIAESDPVDGIKGIYSCARIGAYIEDTDMLRCLDLPRAMLMLRARAEFH